MKVMKKVLSIVLIFAVIQVVGMIFTTNEANAGFFQNAFTSGKQWKEMGGANSNALVDNANGVFQATDEIYTVVRAFGVVLFLINIAITFITLSMHNNGKDIAGMKMTVGFTFALAVLFIFAKQVMDFLQNIFTDFEEMM